MTDRYVRSTDGSDSDDGLNWTNAKATSPGVTASDAAGDRIFFSDNHAESASSITFSVGGIITNPAQLLCVDDAGNPSPPTTLAATATFTATSTFITLNGCFFAYGLNFLVSQTSSSALINLVSLAGEWQVYEKCSFKITGTSVNQRINVGNAGLADQGVCEWKQCDIGLANASQGLLIYNGILRWQGGGVIPGTTSPTALLTPTGRGGSAVIDGVDFSNFGTGFCFISGNQIHPSWCEARNCKLPSGWSGTPISASVDPGVYCHLENCDDGDTQWGLYHHDYAGTTVDETTIDRSANGGAPFALRMDSAANNKYPSIVLRSPEIKVYNATVGSAVTVDIEVIHASVGGGGSGDLTDAELWLEAQYQGTSGFPLGVFASSRVVPLTSASDVPNSTATWDSSPGTPDKQKLSLTFTPQEAGYIILRVCLAKASTTIYVDPKATVS